MIAPPGDKDWLSTTLDPLIKPIDACLGLLPNTQKLYVGFSGGLDSTLLLYCLNALFPDRVVALHVNHQMSSKASDWVSHCEAVCRKWQVPLRVTEVKARLNTQQGVEAELRELRYQAFAQHVEPGGVLCLAHHLDDQAETLLLRLFRGTGVVGLKGIQPLTQRDGMQLVRPWLSVSKSTLLSVAHELSVAQESLVDQRLKLSWVEDESNQDTRWDRNFLRHEVLPVVSRRWPGAKAALARMAHLVATESEGLQPEHCHLLGRSWLPVRYLLGLRVAQQRDLVSAWVRALGIGVPSLKLVTSVVGLGVQANERGQVDGLGHQFRRFDGCVWCVDTPLEGIEGGLKTAEPVAKALVDCQGGVELVWSRTQVFDLPMDTLVCRFRSGSSAENKAEKSADKSAEQSGVSEMSPVSPGVPIFSAGKRIGTHSWKKFFQQHRVPPWLRSVWPLIYFQDQLVSVPHLWSHPAFLAPEGKPGWSFRATNPGILQWMRSQGLR